MDSEVLARALHVLAVVVWIGGVAMETLAVLPALRRMKDPHAAGRMFEDIEQRFAPWARLAVLLAGATGFYMLHVLDAWSRYAQIQYWWIHAMTAIWILFTLVLFVLEPLFLHEWFRRRLDRDPEGTLASLARLHWLLLSVSLVTVLGAIAGAHGVPFFE
ncbi:MAG: hypothetical protein WD767_20815 [Alphaproteobacteria bacterium]